MYLGIYSVFAVPSSGGTVPLTQSQVRSVISHMNYADRSVWW